MLNYQREGGRVVEMRIHDELTERNGHHSSLVNLQLSLLSNCIALVDTLKLCLVFGYCLMFVHYFIH